MLFKNWCYQYLYIGGQTLWENPEDKNNDKPITHGMEGHLALSQLKIAFLLLI